MSVSITAVFSVLSVKMLALAQMNKIKSAGSTHFTRKLRNKFDITGDITGFASKNLPLLRSEIVQSQSQTLRK